jgi:hypothetical protein
MNHPDFFIRPATNQDIPSVKAVVFAVLKEYGLEPDENGKDRDLTDIELSYFSGNGFFGVLVGKNTDIITGTFGLFPMAKHICELRKMYLIKTERGRGIGEIYFNDCDTNSPRKRIWKNSTGNDLSFKRSHIALPEIRIHRSTTKTNQQKSGSGI